MTGRELARVQDHIMLLIKTAQERVAGFLLDWPIALASATRSTSDVAPGHRRLSRPDHRDRIAHAHALEHSAAIAPPLAPHRAARSRSLAAAQQVDLAQAPDDEVGPEAIAMSMSYDRNPDIGGRNHRCLVAQLEAGAVRRFLGRWAGKQRNCHALHATSA